MGSVDSHASTYTRWFWTPNAPPSSPITAATPDAIAAMYVDMTEEQDVLDLDDLNEDHYSKLDGYEYETPTSGSTTFAGSFCLKAVPLSLLWQHTPYLWRIQAICNLAFTRVTLLRRPPKMKAESGF
jgi:hypothetical protein